MQFISKYNKKSNIYVLLVLIVNMHGLFLWKIKSVLQLLLHEVRQAKYGNIRVLSFTTDQWNHGYKIMI